MRLLRIIPLLCAVPLLSGCHLLDLLFQSVPPPPTATLAHYSAFGNTTYDGSECSIPPWVSPNPSDAANTFQHEIAIQEQQQSQFQNDNVSAQQFVAAEGNSDLMWFSGHGDPGLLQLKYCRESGHDANQTSWGPGDLAHTYVANTSGFPVQGLLKWIFTYSSDTVALPPSLLNNSQYTANWSMAFGGSLHGLYGFYQLPGTCSLSDPGFTGSGETCDIPSSKGPGFASSLVEHLFTSRPYETVHHAWINAANDNGIGDRWSIYENSESITDVMSGEGGPNSPNGGILLFYYAGDESAAIVGPAKSIGNDTFRLNPVSLNPEALDDTTLLNSFQSNFGTGADSYTNNGSVSRATKGGGSIVHYLSTSAVSFHGITANNAIAFSESDAATAAAQAAAGINGLPSDAVLTETARQWQVDPATGGAIQVGYLFTWKHSNAIASGDAIRVGVSDYQTSTRTCTGGYTYFYDQLGRSHMICMGWTTTYTNQPNISYSFRMWHTQGSQRHVLSLGQYSITAATAAASLPAAATVIDYAPGNWSGPYYDPSANTATPAWVFTVSGGIKLYVDAYTGQFLGSSAN